MSDWEIKQGDALAVLRTMPSESVQCAITSPPYYGLRSYKTEPQIWDGDEFCNHVWGEQIAFAKQDPRSAELKRQQGATVGGSITFNDVTTTGNSGNYCQACSSWRGELGLESRFHDYIRHLLQIFAEVKRILKPDGVVFCNLGDSYVGAASETPSSRDNSPIAKGTVKSQEQRNGRGERHKNQLAYGLRPKSLMNIPHRFFIAMTDELQMIQRNNINWWKRACMPSSAIDRWTVDFESIGFFTKKAKYKFNQQLEPISLSYANDKRAPGILRQKFYPNSKYVKEGMVELNEGEFPRNRTAENGQGNGELAANVRFGDDPTGLRNARTTWDVGYEPSSENHFASYPTKLVEKMILAGTDEGDTVLDLFCGTGTTLLTALRNKRNALGIELQPEYIKIAEKRLSDVQVKLF